MATIAQWGPKSWVVSPNKVLALQGLRFSYEQTADNNSTTEEEKPTNQRGTELMPLNFSTVLHSGAGVDVRAEIESWDRLVTQVSYFYLGGKRLGPLFQLRKVDVSVDQIDDTGRIRLATLTFELKEYDAATSSVPVTTSALFVKPSPEIKVQKKTTNTTVKKTAKKSIKAGDYVKPTGKKYTTGQTIPNWVKQRKHEVSQIKGDRVLLGHPSGINSWVYLSEVTLA